MSDNWVVQNLQKALATWNEKLQEIWTLLTVSPEEFKGGGIWAVILDVHSGIQAIGLALLVLFFLTGVMKTCSNLSDLKRPEQALQLPGVHTALGSDADWKPPDYSAVLYYDSDRLRTVF